MHARTHTLKHAQTLVFQAYSERWEIEDDDVKVEVDLVSKKRKDTPQQRVGVRVCKSLVSEAVLRRGAKDNTVRVCILCVS